MLITVPVYNDHLLWWLQRVARENRERGFHSLSVSSETLSRIRSAYLELLGPDGMIRVDGIERVYGVPIEIDDTLGRHLARHNEKVRDDSGKN